MSTKTTNGINAAASLMSTYWGTVSSTPACHSLSAIDPAKVRVLK